MSKFACIEGEYEKNDKLKKEDVQMIADWLRKERHLPKIDELKIILFLHSCHYNIEESKRCIDTFYTIRTRCPEFFTNRDPRTNPQDTINLLLYVPLPKLTPEGYRVVLAKLIDPDPDHYTFAGQVKAFDMATMLMLHQEGTHEGIVVITDMKEVTFAHFPKLLSAHLKKFFSYLQDAMPVRIKGIHFVYVPIFMDKVVSLMKPLMKVELFQVLNLHSSNFDSLHKFIPKQCLPADYGGTSGTVEDLIRIQSANLLENADYFVEEEKLIVDESLRMGPRKGDKELFGVEGTFRKLSID